MLTLGAIVPHSPLLIPNVGKEKRDALSETLRAYRELEERMYTAGVESLIIISPHGPAFPDAFSANIATRYEGNMKAFGDHETSIHAECDLQLIDGLREGLRAADVPFAFTTSEELDYGCTIPLLLMTRHLKAFRIVPLAPSLLPARAHADFGAALRLAVERTTTRVAVIASADLSHKLDPRSPEGGTIEGPAFDTTIRNKVKTLDADGLLAMDPEAVEAAGQCGYRPIVTLLGCFRGMETNATELVYEAPYGAGYLTALIEPK